MVDLAAPSVLGNRSPAAIHPFYWRLGYMREGEKGYIDEPLDGKSIRFSPPNPIELQIVRHSLEMNPDTHELGDMRTPVLSIELRSNVIDADEGLAPGMPWVPVFYRHRYTDRGPRPEDYVPETTARTIFGRARRKEETESGDVRLWAYIGESDVEISDVPQKWISMSAIKLMFDRET